MLAHECVEDENIQPSQMTSENNSVEAGVLKYTPVVHQMPISICISGVPLFLCDNRIV